MPFGTHLGRRARRGLFVGALALALGGIAFAADEILKPGAEKPADAVTLFDGSDTVHWEPVGDTMWQIEDGVFVDNANDIQTKDKFKDYQLHLEFNEPMLGAGVQEPGPRQQRRLSAGPV